MFIKPKPVHKKITTLALSIAMAMGSVSLSYAASSFKDVSVSHWAWKSQAIQWGLSNKVVSGYPDGTFKPNNQVTEAEFLVILIGAYVKVNKEGVTGWKEPFYEYAWQKNWVSSVEQSTTKLTRQRVAEFIAAANGVHYTGDQAITFVLGKKLANGKVAGDISVSGFKGSDLLTRAEALQFIKTAEVKGLTELKERPQQPSDPAQLPSLPQPKPESKPSDEVPLPFKPKDGSQDNTITHITRAKEVLFESRPN